MIIEWILIVALLTGGRQSYVSRFEISVYPNEQSCQKAADSRRNSKCVQLSKVVVNDPLFGSVP